VVAWGDNHDGQSTVPSDLTGVIAIAAGFHHSLALVSTAPKLLAKQIGSDFVISWPASAQSFILQTTTNLSGSNSWTPPANAPSLHESHYFVTNATSDARRFYRLIESGP
jgi:hypothetical protein